MKLGMVVASLGLGVALVVSSGCSGTDSRDSEQPVAQARGVVLYKKKPVANAAVTFQSLDGTVAAAGTTGAAGAFVLSTYATDDGAPPGKYRVLVAATTVDEVEPDVLAPEPEGGFKSPIPTKYADADTSDILVEVTQGGKNEFTIELK